MSFEVLLFASVLIKFDQNAGNHVKENESIRIIQSNNKSLAYVHFSDPLGRVFPIEKTRCNTLLFFKS